MEYEQIIMKLIMHGGEARTKSLMAIKAAREKDFAASKELLDYASEQINHAHETQTGLIQSEVRGENKTAITLLMVHAQDHLMNAMTVRDLAIEIIENLK